MNNMTFNNFQKGFNVVEHALLKKNQLVVDKDNKIIYCGNIYPFCFLGCGKETTLEECVDAACNYAVNKVHKWIDKQFETKH
jgi:hypothetical protein